MEALKAELAAEKARVKELSPLAQKAKEAEEAQKSEAQRAAEALTAATARAEAAELNLLRVKVGTAKGLPPEIAARLSGKDEQEMAADADALLEVLKAASPSGTPTPPAGGGVAGSGGAPTGMDMNALLRAAVRGTT